MFHYKMLFEDDNGELQLTDLYADGPTIADMTKMLNEKVHPETNPINIYKVAEFLEIK